MPKDDRRFVIIDDRELYREIWRLHTSPRRVHGLEYLGRPQRRRRVTFIISVSDKYLHTVLGKLRMYGRTIVILDTPYYRDYTLARLAGADVVLTHLSKINTFNNLIKLARKRKLPPDSLVGFRKAAYNLMHKHYVGHYAMGPVHYAVAKKIISDASRTEIIVCVGISLVKYRRILSDLFNLFHVDNILSLKIKMYTIGCLGEY